MIKLPIHAATVPEPVAIEYIKDDSQMLHGVRHAPYGVFGCVKQSMQLVKPIKQFVCISFKPTKDQTYRTVMTNNSMLLFWPVSLNLHHLFTR